jgi:3-oxoacyl-[acyl-carrier protein] reductase
MLQLDLSGKIALITGGTGQLGRVMATTLAQCGADVAIHYFRQQEGAVALAASIRAMGRRALTCSGDVGVASDVALLSQRVLTEWGRVDIVVANAVEQIFPWQPLLQQDVSAYESQFRSCVLQNVLLAKAFVPGMVERGWGRYIGINTECTIQLLPTQSAYASGKRGMDGVLRVLAKETQVPGVTVNQVAPGWTISERSRSVPEADAEYVKGIPLRRRGTDQEIANVVTFLASDLASYVHGAFLPVCGGNVMP